MKSGAMLQSDADVALTKEAVTKSATARQKGRRRAVSAMKRRLILEAARDVFERDGLDGASLRAIAKEAGYTPAALYFHFDSKEAIYGEVLMTSLARLQKAVGESVGASATPACQLKKAALAFFDFYAENPRDLDLGFYLFRGGMKPHGLGKERDGALNAALAEALGPIVLAARDAGLAQKEAKALMVDLFAHASGLLLLAHTGRIRMFDISARKQMMRYIDQQLDRLP